MTKTPLTWVHMAGGLYATGSIDGKTVKIAITPGYSSSAAWVDMELYTIDGGGKHYIARRLGYIVDHKDAPKPAEIEKNKYQTLAEAGDEIKALAEFLFNS